MTKQKSNLSPSLRILCLHDQGSSAPELKEVLRLLGDRLYESHKIDLVYVNSPFITLPTIASKSEETHLADEKNHRAWWWCTDAKQENQKLKSENDVDDEIVANDEVDVGITTSMSIDPLSDKENEEIQSRTSLGSNMENQSNQLKNYRGLDASLMLLRQIWTSCPFWGIIGVGQGAAVASLLMLTILYRETSVGDDQLEDSQDRQLLPPPQLAIFIEGQSLLPQDEPLLDLDRIPTLHLFIDSENSSTSIISNRETQPKEMLSRERLMRQFGGSVHVLRRNLQNDNIPVKGLNVIGRFIIQQKMNLMSCINGRKTENHEKSAENNSNLEIVALQTALHQVELEAIEVITNEIMSNPPPGMCYRFRFAFSLWITLSI